MTLLLDTNYVSILCTLQDFIAQCIGVRYVGFAVAVWAFSSAISSFLAGRAVKYVKIEIHTVLCRSWIITILVSIPDLLQASGEFSSGVLGLFWIWTL